MNSLTLSIAILMGFTGSLHCAAMCGPIIWVMPFERYAGIKKGFALSLYHFGRISVYAAMALLLHSFAGFFQPVVQQYISITLGVSLLLLGIFSFLPGTLFKFRLPWDSFIKNKLGSTIGAPGLAPIFLAGTLNGLLPCGLVYMALSATVTLSTAAQAAAFMYVFGLGTMPMLVAITVLKGKVSVVRLHSVRRFVPVVVFAFGCLLVLRGMNLGIPYLSPKVVVIHHAIHSACCHK